MEGRAVAVALAEAALSRSRLLLVGCGGTGGELAKSLSKFAAELTLIDFDTIELTNLHRQFFFGKADVGRAKASVVAQKLARLNGGLRVNALCRSVFAEEFDEAFFAGFDAVLLGLDNEEARSAVNRRCAAAATPVFECASAGLAGQAYAIFPRASRCYDCFERPRPAAHPVCSVRSRPTQLVHCALWAKLVLEALLGPADDSSLAPPLSGPDRAASLHRALVFLFETSLAELKDSRPPVQPLALSALSPSDCYPAPELERLRRFLMKSHPGFRFDKDEEEHVEALDALTALRARCFGIAAPRPGEARRLATNVVPAVSSTNSLVAGLLTLELVKFLVKKHCGQQGLELGREERVRLAQKETYVGSRREPVVLNAFVQPPAASCRVCAAETAQVSLSLECKLKQVLAFFEQKLAASFEVYWKSSLLFSSDDLSVDGSPREASPGQSDSERPESAAEKPLKHFAENGRLELLIVPDASAGKRSVNCLIVDSEQTKVAATDPFSHRREQYKRIIEEDAEAVKAAKQRATARARAVFSPARAGSLIDLGKCEEGSEAAEDNPALKRVNKTP